MVEGKSLIVIAYYVVVLPLASPFGIGIVQAGGNVNMNPSMLNHKPSSASSSLLQALPSTAEKTKKQKVFTTSSKSTNRSSGGSSNASTAMKLSQQSVMEGTTQSQTKPNKQLEKKGKKRRSILSRLLFTAVSPLTHIASQRQLESTDITSLNTDETMERHVPEFQAIYDRCRAKAQKYHETLRSTELQLEQQQQLQRQSPKTTPNTSQYNHNNHLKRKLNERIAKSESLVLAKAIILHQKHTLLRTGLLRLLNTTIQAFPALLVARLLRLIESGDAHHPWKPLQAALSLVGVLLLKMVVENQYFHQVIRCATQVRGSLSGVIFDKTLRLSSGGGSTSGESDSDTKGEIKSSGEESAEDGKTKKSSKELGSGGVLNLMQSDASTIELAAIQVHTLWDGILQISIYTFLLFRLLGPSVLWGLGLLLLQIPTNSFGLRILNRLTAKQNKAKEARTRKTTEAISNMKLLKLQAWERSFEDNIRVHREEELRRNVNKGTFRALNSAISNAIPAIILVVTLAAYKRTGRPIVASTIFTAISLFNQLRFPLFFYPMLIDAMANGKNSLRRISSYLCQEELSPYVRKYPKLNDGKNGRIVMKNGNFLWSSAKASVGGSTKPTPAAAALCGAEVDVKPGEIVAVVGPVGSGKTSLVKALLGELQPVPRIVVDQSLESVSLKSSNSTSMHGQEASSHSVMDIPVVSAFGDVSYCAQESWLSKGTIREAVVFGREYNEARYLKAIYDAGLDEDIVDISSSSDISRQGMLSHDTEVGEGGSSLSGGQRARVQLARALYEDGGVYLLDDPLSALDASVGATVFERMTKSLRERNAAVVFVTNDPSLPRRCDKVILMGGVQSGSGKQTCSRIVDSGSYDELIHRGHNLRTISSSEVISLTEEEGRAKKIMNNNTDGTESITMHADPDSQVSIEHEPDFLIEHKDLLHSEVNLSNNTSELKTHITKQRDETPPTKEKTKNLDEMMKTGAVPFSTYTAYLKSARKPSAILFTLACVIMVNGAQFFQQYTVAKWTELGNSALSASLGAKHLQSLVYAAITVSVFLFFRSYMIMRVGTRASQFLHSRMLSTVFKAPVSFFDNTPSGQLLSRFGKEIETIDRAVPDSFASVMYCFLQILMTFAGLAGVVTPKIVGPLVVIAFMYNSTMSRFRPAARDLKRHESKSRSPIYTHFGEALRGAETIRSFRGSSETWSSQNRYLVDDNLSVFYTMKTLDRWLSIRLESLGNLVVLSAALAAVVMTRSGSLSAGSAGWGLTQALSITGLLAWTVRVITDLESQMMSVSRVLELCNLDSTVIEGSFPSNEIAPMIPVENEGTGSLLPVSFNNHSQVILSSPMNDSDLIKSGWPWHGSISFKNASMRYSADSPLVLKDVSIDIPQGSTLGVVGRTGSGKSSLLLTLFRITELEAGGSIEIDGVDIKSVRLQTLRQSLSIIPQDPVLFSGTVIYNLDATGKATEEEAWAALETASPDLAHQFRSSGYGLNSTITEGGKNLSSGQRQLICLARALLGKCKILVLDEATSSVDSNTDAQVQATIRREFVNKGVSVITVAHRLDTVMGSDKIAVLDAGELIEYGSPRDLLKLPNGTFRQLVDADRKNKKRGASADKNRVNTKIKYDSIEMKDEVSVQT